MNGKLGLQVVVLLFGPLLATAAAQRAVRVVQQTRLDGGVVRAVSPTRITLADVQGNTFVCHVGTDARRGVALAAGVIAFESQVRVTGQIAPRQLRPGMVVTVEAVLSRSGTPRQPLRQITWKPKLTPEVKRLEAVADTKTYRYRITGAVVRNTRSGLTLQVPRNPWFRKRQLKFRLARDARVNLEATDLERVKPGDRVLQALLWKFDTGEWVVKSIHVQLAPQDDDTAPGRTKAEDRYARYSDAPRKPRDVRSAHFLLHTDISERKVRILLDRLETMYGLLAKYFGRRPRQPIRCFVVRDLAQWPADTFPPEAFLKIRNREGVTIHRTLGSQVQAIVYSCDNPEVVQHEAVHAFCALTFGSTGPTWYAEGIAELGHYWKPNQLAVDVPPVVITYLKTSRPKTLAEIVAPGQITGDSWQAYAWRWALCYLLMHNPNYAPRFRALGIGLMSRRPGVSFQSVYGPVARQISFEYDFFVKHVDNGFRADLVAWDWKTRFRPLRIGARRTVTVKAKAGWQATGVKVQAGEGYRYRAAGTWKIDSLEAVTADGRPDGQGRLVGVLFQNFQLSEPFELGAEGTWTAPASGQLFVRCRDAWSQLGDNSGSVVLTIERE